MSDKPVPHHEKRQKQAERDLQRVSEQSEIIGSSAMRRSAERARDHMSGADADPDDRVEVWGRRIGRSLGLVFLVGLIWYLGVTYF